MFKNIAVIAVSVHVHIRIPKDPLRCRAAPTVGAEPYTILRTTAPTLDLLH